MKSHIQLLRVVLDDLGTRCCTCTSRDLKTITARIEHEGLSFLTITLPDFCKGLQKGLDSGQVDPSLFPKFKTRKGMRRPEFLRGWLDLVFDPSTGRLLDEPNEDAIYAIRQLTLLYSKILLPCSQAREKASFKRFIECEQNVRKNDLARLPSLMKDFSRVVTLVWADLFSFVDKYVYDGLVKPRHGPGATAEKLRGNAKYLQTEWPRRLEQYFPHGEFLFTSWRHFLDASDVHILEPGAERPVRVVSVPKTLKTPRIIAIEPTAMQYAQQGVMRVIVDAIGRHDILSELVGFDDQTPNQRLAYQGSLNQDLATLDLSDASDSVSNQLVRHMLANWPHFGAAVDACRSRKADVPGHGVVRLAKFASMGSALTFPIESMVFLTIALLGIEEKLNRPLNYKTVKALVGKVRVYGDDIVVPVDSVRSVIGKLQAFGFKVNADKSFWTGKFRESCGKEYYNGVDVSVVKLRRELPRNRKHVQEVISSVSFRNQMYYSGNWKTAAYLDRLLERIIPLPTVLPTSPALGRHSHLGFFSNRECPFLQRPLVKAAVVSARPPASELNGWNALLKCFLLQSDEPIADSKHLERAGRPDAVDIKLRWVPAY